MSILDLSIDEFIEFCKKNGLAHKKDHQIIQDEALTPRALLELTTEDIEGLKLTLGGKRILQNKILPLVKKAADQSSNTKSQEPNPSDSANSGYQDVPERMPWCMDTFMMKPREHGAQSSNNEIGLAASQRIRQWKCDGPSGGINLTVKFLRSIPHGWTYGGGGLNHDFILNLAKKWEKNDLVNFTQVKGNMPADIRVEFIDSSLTYEKLFELFGSVEVKLLEKHLVLIPQPEGSKSKMECIRVYADKKPTWEDVVVKLQNCGLTSEANDVKATYIDGRATSRSCVGSTAQNVSPLKPTMWLNLSTGDDNYKQYLVIHEFGHALGLEHEHQRPDFWDAIRKYIDIDKMLADEHLQGNREWIDNLKIKHGDLICSDYDDESIMHYWFKLSWLKDGYKTKTEVEGNENLTKEEKKALLGIHKRSSEPLPTTPSQLDLDHLKTMYGKKDQPAVEIPANVKGSKPRISSDYSDVKETDDEGKKGPKQGAAPQPVVHGYSSVKETGGEDFSGLKDVDSILLDLIRWNEDKEELRIYASTAKHWKTIARKLGLEKKSPGYIDNLMKMKFNDDNECVRDVFSKWLENAVGLPNADRYPKTWKGLRNLLVDSDAGEVDLNTALNAADSSARPGRK